MVTQNQKAKRKDNLKGELTIPPFLCKLNRVYLQYMNKEKVKLIIQNMELLVESLKNEILDKGEPKKYSPDTDDYDEVFGDFE